MKFFDLRPIMANIVDTFIEDPIGRTNDVYTFVGMLKDVDSICTIGIDGMWGTGKTFFVKQAKTVIDSFNPLNNYYKKEEAKRIRKKTIKDRNDFAEFPPFLTAYYDAWMHDDEEDPVLSLLYEIVKDNSLEGLLDNSREWDSILSSVISIISNRDVSGLVENLKGGNVFNSQKDNERLDRKIEELLKAILLENGNRLVVFIDELDRCRPEFSVKLLERIKHYFSVENVLFVFSINFSALQNSIKHYYGAEFDACRYLDRFFDIRMELPKIDMSDFIRLFGVEEHSDMRECVCSELIKQMNLSMREASRLLCMTKAAAYKFIYGGEYEKAKRGALDNGIADLVGYCAIVPIAIALKLTDYEEYNAFISGLSDIWLERVLMSEKVSDFVMYVFLGNDEAYGNIQGGATVTKEEKIKEVYEAIFVKQYDSEPLKQIGRAIFDKNSRVKYLKAINMLSTHADYSC